MTLLHTLQASLRVRWDSKLPKLLDRARNFASAASGRLMQEGPIKIDKALREAYIAGYREGYWEGVIDVVECGTAEGSPIEDERLSIH